MARQPLVRIAFVVLALGATGVAQSANLVVNGGFETTSSGGPGQIGFSGYTAAPWTNNPANPSYNFVFDSATVSTSGANGQFGNVSLWGPGNGSANGLGASPNGGNFLASDPDFQLAALQQTITGLTVGQHYQLSFYWGGAQQFGFDGLTTDGWQVSLGSETHSTAIVNNGNHGFTGWFSETMDFTATATSEVLSFLAQGSGGAALPPFVLLDGVSLQGAVPIPASFALLATGALSLGAVRLRRRGPVAAV